MPPVVSSRCCASFGPVTEGPRARLIAAFLIRTGCSSPACCDCFYGRCCPIEGAPA
jgi:hypothetical protein